MRFLIEPFDRWGTFQIIRANRVGCGAVRKQKVEGVDDDHWLDVVLRLCMHKHAHLNVA